MDTGLILFAVGGAAVLALGIWLRRQQARFEAGLRAAGDPLADAPRDKTYRQRFQAWLFGLGEGGGPAPARGVLTLLLALAVFAIAAYSLFPWIFGG